MMNLRDLDKRATPNSEFRPSQISAIDFHLPPSLIGNLGGPLVDGLLELDANEANEATGGVANDVHPEVLDRIERSE